MMMNQQLKIVSSLIDEYCSIKNTNIEKIVDFNNLLIKKTLQLNLLKVNNSLNYNLEFIHNFNKYNEELLILNRSKSILFNPLSYFNPGETMHSFLIAKMINPYSEHGQGKLFLQYLLEILEIEMSENDHWIVTAESGRIDILLKRHSPHSVVVFENKSNYAVDQENQLYRYWYQEIYLPNSFRKDPVQYTMGNKNYQIIYLTPSKDKLPSVNSMTRPMGYDKFLPEIIPIKPEIWLFSDKIVNWLTICLNNLPKENYRLREYLQQYIELWTI